MTLKEEKRINWVFREIVKDAMWILFGAFSMLAVVVLMQITTLDEITWKIAQQAINQFYFPKLIFTLGIVLFCCGIGGLWINNKTLQLQSTRAPVIKITDYDSNVFNIDRTWLVDFGKDYLSLARVIPFKDIDEFEEQSEFQTKDDKEFFAKLIEWFDKNNVNVEPDLILSKNSQKSVMN